MMLLALTETPSLGADLSGVVTTFVVLGVLVAAAWMLRRGTFSIGWPRRAKPLGFGVETAFSLGERRSLAIVSVEGRRLLLGLTPTTVSLITELPVSSGSFDAALDRRVVSEPSR